MDTRGIFASNLKKLRHEKGFSQEELAHLAKLDRTYISALERCMYSASIDVVDRIAHALDTQASTLLKSDSN